MRDLGDGFILDRFSRHHVTPENISAMGALIEHLTSGKKRGVTEEDIRRTIAQENFYISAIFQNGLLVGMASIHINRWHLSHRIAYVDDVVVAPATQGRGLSRVLMADLERQARDWSASYIDLTSSPDRVAANSLYQKLGFAPQDVSSFRIPVPKGKPPIWSFGYSAHSSITTGKQIVHSIRTLMGRKAFVDSRSFSNALGEAIPGELLAAAMLFHAEELNVFTPNDFDGTQLTELGFEKRDTNVYRLEL